MKFNKALMALMLAVVMVVGLCASAMAEDAIKIGVIGPFTGAAAIYGNACKFGAQVAAEQINAQGGMQIELLNEDDEHDPEKSIVPGVLHRSRPGQRLRRVHQGPQPGHQDRHHL